MHPDLLPFLIALALFAAVVAWEWFDGRGHPVRRELRHRRAARHAFPILPVPGSESPPLRSPNRMKAT